MGNEHIPLDNDTIVSLLRELSQALGARHAMASELLPGQPARARTLAFLLDGQPAGSVEFAISGTPCESVLRDGVCFFPDNLAGLFPDDVYLREYGLDNYMGIPLRLPGVEGRPDGRGLIAFMNYRPIQDTKLAASLLEALASRVSAEMERTEALRLVSRQNELLRKITDTVPVAILVAGIDGEVKLVNRFARDFTGMSEEDFTRRGLSQNVWQIRHTDGRPVSDEERPAIRALRYGETSRGAYFVAQTPAGIRHASVGAAPLLSAGGEIEGVVSVVQDITAQAQALDALRETSERLQLIASSINEVFWLSSPKIEEVLYVSPGIERVWGVSAAELSENPARLFECVHEDDRERFSEFITSHSGEPYVNEYRIRRPDGEVRWIRDRGSPVRNEQGELVWIAGVSTDITEQKQLESQFLQSQRLEAIGLLAGGIAHDFNNLLTVINGYSRLLRDETLGPRQTEFVTEILAAGERAAELTSQLLAFGRKQTREPRPLDLSAVVRDARRMLSSAAGATVHMEFDLPRGLPAVIADPGQIHQILMNLVINARDAMNGDGRIRIRVEGVRWSPPCGQAAPAQPWIRLSVSDTGTGMAPEVVARAFEPFFTTKPPGKGTGLGLPSVYGIVRQSGGHVVIEDTTPGGTTLAVYLPPVVDKAVSAVPENREAGEVRHGGRILLVEDQRDVRQVAVLSLQSFGYEVEECATATEALESLGRGAPDLLLTDIHMPGMNGVDLARRARAQYPGLPILLLSGYSEEASEGFPHFGKPFVPTALVERVAELLRAGQGA